MDASNLSAHIATLAIAGGIGKSDHSRHKRRSRTWATKQVGLQPASGNLSVERCHTPPHLVLVAS